MFSELTHIQKGVKVTCARVNYARSERFSKGNERKQLPFGSAAACSRPVRDLRLVRVFARSTREKCPQEQVCVQGRKSHVLSNSIRAALLRVVWNHVPFCQALPKATFHKILRGTLAVSAFVFSFPVFERSLARSTAGLYGRFSTRILGSFQRRPRDLFPAESRVIGPPERRPKAKILPVSRRDSIYPRW